MRRRVSGHLALTLLSISSSTFAAEQDLPCTNVHDAAHLSTLCGFAKPEDLQFVPSKGVVIVSEQGWQAPASGGSISVVAIDAAVRLGKKRALWPSDSAKTSQQLIGDPACTTPPTDEFSPHGLSVLEHRRRVQLAIVNHGGREAIELFEIRGSRDELHLEWRGCVPLPPDTAANDVAIHSDGRLFVTNYAPSTRDMRAVKALFAALRGEVTGDVMEWSRKNGWRHVPYTEGAMPNGILIDERRNRLFVAELGKQRVVEIELGRDGSAARRAEFVVQDLADDLNWTKRGTILLGGQKRGRLTEWSVSEIDPKTGKVRVLFDNETALHSVTSATDIGKGIVFGSAGDQRIGIAPWPDTKE